MPRYPMPDTGEYDAFAPITERMLFILMEVEELEDYAKALLDILFEQGITKVPAKPFLEACNSERLRLRFTIGRIRAARRSKNNSRFRLERGVNLRSRANASPDLTLEDLEMDPPSKTTHAVPIGSDEDHMADYKPDPQALSALAQKLGLEVPREGGEAKGSESSVSEGRDATQDDLLKQFEKDLGEEK